MSKKLVAKSIVILSAILTLGIVSSVVISSSKNNPCKDIVTLPIESGSDVHTVEKPIIYLYPKEDNTDIQYQSNVPDNIFCSYPMYNTKDNAGWKVKADKDGTIYSNNREYPYLYWEFETKVLLDNICLNDGWVIKSSEVIPFLEEKLTYLNLTDKEQADFISYWLPSLIIKPYVYIKFANDEFKDYVNPTITPTPDTYLPVFMVFLPLDDPNYPVKEQELVPLERKGYTVVEWGGMKLR